MYGAVDHMVGLNKKNLLKKKFIRPVLKSLTKASFTVEAAVLVLIAATIIAVIIGYAYFLMERTCTYGAMYEAAFYSEQLSYIDNDEEKRLEERLNTRSREMLIGCFEYAADLNENRISIDASGAILKNVFKERFMYNRSVRIKRLKPTSVKRVQWLAKYLKNSNGKGEGS